VQLVLDEGAAEEAADTVVRIVGLLGVVDLGPL